MIFWEKTKLCTNTYKLFLLAHGSATGEFCYLGFLTNQFGRTDEHIVLLTYSLHCLCNPCSQIAVRWKKHLFQVAINQLKPIRSISLTAESCVGNDVIMNLLQCPYYTYTVLGSFDKEQKGKVANRKVYQLLNLKFDRLTPSVADPPQWNSTIRQNPSNCKKKIYIC